MFKNLIVLPDGTEIGSGAGTVNAIKSHTLTACVNDSNELSIGSVCANVLEMKLFSPGGNLSLTAGDEVTLYKVDDAGNRVKNGIFVLEKPTRPTANTTKITGYDRVIKLDKDLTAWLKGLTGWPYSLSTFAGMVCTACGLTLATTDIPNGSLPVYQFSKSSVTGRQLMQWIGEACCRFCRANADGEIEFAWYTPSGVTIAPTGDRYYFQGALSYETYQVAPVDAVQLRLADSDYGALWPEAEEGANAYIISGNPIFIANVTDDLLPYLQTIEEYLAGVTYTPCKISIPACLDIDAGSIVNITDKNGSIITAYVMTKTTSGQKDTLECTGSQRRNSSTAINNKKVSASQAANDAFASLTQAQVFAKLTDNGKIQGIYAYDDKWYINAEVAKIINLSAESIDTTNLKVAAANITGTLVASQIDATDLKVSAANITGTITAGKIIVKNASGLTLLSAGDNAVSIAGWKADSNSLYSGDSFSSAECFICTGSAGAFDIGGSGLISGWMLKAGSDWGVTKDGAMYAANAYIKGKVEASSGSFSGTINAKDGSIGPWAIGTITYNSDILPCLTAQGDDGAIYLTTSGIIFLPNGSTHYITASWRTICANNESWV